MKKSGKSESARKNFNKKAGCTKKSQATQTPKSEMRRPLNVVKPLVTKFGHGALHSNEVHGQCSKGIDNMENLSKKFFSLVKKNAMEKKSNERREIEDIHLIKNQVSVKQIKKVFLQMSKSSIGINNEEKSCAKKRSHTITRKSYSNCHSSLLTEFLQTVVKKQLSRNEGEKSHTFDNLENTNFNKKDEKLILQADKHVMNHFVETHADITAYPLLTKGTIHMVDGLEKINLLDDEIFQPKLYSFRLLSDAPLTNLQIMTRPPAFSTLLDNFIAVIWGLSKEENVGINPLQWAYELLKVIRYKNGMTPDIVETFKQKIQDKLIDSYAELYELKEKKEEENSYETLKEHLKRKLSIVSLTCAKRNKWVSEMTMIKSYSLREIVKRGRNSISKPGEDDKLVIKSLIPTATLTTHPSHSKTCVVNNVNIDDSNNVFLKHKCRDLDDIKKLLSKMRQTHTEKLQQELSSIKKIENFLVKVDDKFKPSLTYEAAQIVTSHEKLN